MHFDKLQIKLMKLKLKIMGKHCSPLYFTKILRKEGFSIGEHTVFYDPLSHTFDRQRPWLLKIGDYCKITRGTTILCHDYSRSVLRRAYGEVIGEAAMTTIGNNVFIGVNSIILMGATIGDNVIIGAGSVVVGNIPDNCVAAGNPAKIISTLDAHYKKRKSKYLNEARLCYSMFKKYYGRTPTIQEMNAFFPIYTERTRTALTATGINLNLNGDNKEEIIDAFLRTSPIYPSYDDFKKEMIE